jgi:hypothetical protein
MNRESQGEGFLLEEPYIGPKCSIDSTVFSHWLRTICVDYGPEVNAIEEHQLKAASNYHILTRFSLRDFSEYPASIQ